MSAANIPLEIQVEIIKRVPVKSLVRFRSLSKQWKSLIDSSEFISDHTANQTQPHHLLLLCCSNTEDKYVSLVDDHSFPQHTAVSPTVKLARHASVLGYSHGLVCLFGFSPDPLNRKNLVVVWNPSIRKSVAIVLPRVFEAVGFGVCPKTLDPKIVMIKRIDTVGYTAEVFTLLTSGGGAWRSVISTNQLPHHKSIHFSRNPVVIDGVIYWIVCELATTNDESNRVRIFLFDLTSEEFREVNLPDSLAGPTIHLSKLKESLVVLSCYTPRDAGKSVCDVWMMLKKNACFTKIFTVNVNPYNIIGFRKNGQPIMELPCTCDGFRGKELQVYEPGSEHTSRLGIYASVFKMASYTESLLLLNHTAADSIIQ